MLPAGMVAAIVAYGVGSWGYVLLKGWNISLREWFSPVSPYKWPAGGQDPPKIPADSLFPKAPPVATQ